MKRIVFLFFIILLVSCQKPINVEELELKAKSYCSEETVVMISECEGYIHVISNVAGVGSTYYKRSGSQLQCPLVAPDSLSEECQKLIFGQECDEKEIC